MEIKGGRFREGESFIHAFFNSYNIYWYHSARCHAMSAILLRGKIFPEVLETTLLLEKSLLGAAGWKSGERKGKKFLNKMRSRLPPPTSFLFLTNLGTSGRETGCRRIGELSGRRNLGLKHCWATANG